MPLFEDLLTPLEDAVLGLQDVDVLPLLLVAHVLAPHFGHIALELWAQQQMTHRLHIALELWA